MENWVGGFCTEKLIDDSRFSCFFFNLKFKTYESELSLWKCTTIAWISDVNFTRNLGTRRPKSFGNAFLRDLSFVETIGPTMQPRGA